MNMLTLPHATCALIKHALRLTPSCLAQTCRTQARDEFFKMILDTPGLKTSHGFRKAKELLEGDERWKVSGVVVGGCQAVRRLPGQTVSLYLLSMSCGLG